MPYIQLAGSAANSAGQASAAFGDAVSPAVNALSNVALGVANLKLRREGLEAEKASDLARQMLQREELKLYGERTQIGRIGEQSKRAAAEVEERTKLAEQRAKLAEQARQLGYPATPEGTVGLLEELRAEDPEGWRMVAGSVPGEIENDEQLMALWRSAADTLTAGRTMREQADKVGSARRVAESVEVGSQFWTEDHALQLQALATDPNVSGDEFAAAKSEFEAEAKAAFARKTKVATYAKQARKLYDSVTLTGEQQDRALSILSDFEGGDPKDPETLLLKMTTLVAGLDPALARAEEDAFNRGRLVGLNQPPTFPATANYGPAAALDPEALSNMRPQPKPAGPRIAGESKLGGAFRDETANEGARIRAAMRAQGLDPTDDAAIEEFLDAEERRAPSPREQGFPRAGGPF